MKLRLLDLLRREAEDPVLVALDHLLEGLLPGIYVPLYAMVTFSRMPYAEAAKRAELQDRIVHVSLLLAVSLICILLLIALV